MHVLPNPVDVSGIRAEASDRLPRDGRFTFCVSGRLASQKGIDVLIRALALARDGLGQDWRCRILGEGELRGPLEALVASLGLEARVDFLGHLTDPYSVMAACDVFVHPARWEGFGLVVAEALALGLPVIATTCPGAPKEMLEGGELGWLVPPDDPSALARALLQAAQDDDQRKRFAESAPQALARYAPGRVAQLACSLADEIVK